MMPSLTYLPGPGVPEKYPDTTPRNTPTTKAMVEDTSAMVRSMRGAEITREKISIPDTSVPIQFSNDGAVRETPGKACSGSKGAITGPNIARKSVIRTITSPVMNDGRLAANRQKLRITGGTVTIQKACVGKATSTTP
tara:strand:- start:137 stop:550 length:414 start_codon:yes stop_codon:yes gene_type:complete